MHLPIRLFLAAGLLICATACQTHDRVIYETRSPKNLRVAQPGVDEVPLDTTSPPSANPHAATPSAGGPSAPAVAQ